MHGLVRSIDTRRRRGGLLAVAACLVACTTDRRPVARGDSTPASLPSAPARDWRELRGDGFVLRYPPDASLVSDTSHPDGIVGTAIRGPTITVHLANPESGPSTGPAYKLIVSDEANPSGESVDVWVDSVRRASNAQIAAGVADSVTYLAPPDTLRVGVEHALKLTPFCGDCAPEDIYVAGPRRRVVIAILYDISIVGDRAAQRRLYDAILGTFRWTSRG